MSDSSEMSYRDLQKKCKELGLTPTGSKHVLQKRLDAHIKEHGDNPLNGAPEADGVDDNEPEEDQEDAGDEDVDQDEEVIEAHEDEEDEDAEDEEDEVMRLQLGDGEYVELIGALVRKSPRKLEPRAEAPNGEEKAEGDDEEDDEDDKLFVVGTKVLRQAYQDELNDAIQTLQEKEEELVADEEAAEEADADAMDSDAESDFDLEPQLYRKGHISARLISQFLSAVELLFVFIALLHLPSSTAADPDLGERASGFQVLLSSFVAQTLNPSFWISVVVYFVCFFAVPTLLGLLLGKYNTAECVFGFAVARWVCFYLLSDFKVFDWDSNGFVTKLFNVTTAVSLVSAFWEKQSEHYL